jgi:hypothetical protein
MAPMERHAAACEQHEAERDRGVAPLEPLRLPPASRSGRVQAASSSCAALCCDPAMPVYFRRAARRIGFRCRE